MNVLGKDKSELAYRVGAEIAGREVIALVPDTLLASQYGQDGKVSHGQAYEWIATQRHDLMTAMQTLVRGARPKAPFDQITLEGRD